MSFFDLQYFAKDSPTGQKTEKPTGRQLQKAREKGQVAKSIDLSGAIVLMAGLGVIYLFGGYMKNEIDLYMKFILRECMVPLTDGRLRQVFVMTLTVVLKVLAPLFAAVVTAAIAVNLYETEGLLFTMEQFRFKGSKFNPVTNLKNKFFSLKTMVETAKSIAKIFVIGYFPYRVLRGSMKTFLLLPRMEMEPIVAFIVSTIVKILIQVCIVLLILALIDFAYQKWEHQKQLMMSKYDIKQERKQMEGDPHVKMEQKKRARRAMLRAMMGDVPQADVVLTNPTHLAVALRYDQESNVHNAPYVVAKGAGEIARKIKEIARSSNVPVLENKILARAIYYSCEIGEEIPSELFQQIAEILSFVYRNKAGRAA